MIHPVFDSFLRFEGPTQPGFFLDWLGVRTRPEFFQPFYKADPSGQYLKPDLPAVNEELFEWIDLLTAIEKATDKFTMIELGAGYGRWMVRAALAIQRMKHARPLSPILIGVEPEPHHYSWICEHFKDNGLKPSRHVLIKAAVTNENGVRILNLGSDQPGRSYGQSLADPHSGIHPSQGTPVRCTTLADVIPTHGVIDFLDVDVQGEELKTLLAACSILNGRVKFIHIGTHSEAVEYGLRHLFQGLGWDCIHYFGCNTTQDTPYGQVTFQDGVQSWLNPKLAVLDHHNP